MAMTEEEQAKLVEDFKKVQEQVDNLNKGIATYRDTAQSSAKEAAEAKKLAADLQTKLEEVSKGGKKDEPEVEPLSPKDEARLKAWAEAQGFVSKDALEAEKAKIQADSFTNMKETVINEFLAAHPEYDKDEEWAKVNEQFTLYKIPSSETQFRAILNKIHKDLSGGKSDDDNGSGAEAIARAKIAASQMLRAGGRPSSGGASKDNSVESLMARYPNLSRSQIESRMGELNELFPEKK